MCLPLICAPFHELSCQMDHMIPFQPQPPNSPPFTPRPLGFHLWLHLCLNLIEMLAHVNKGDFASMGVQQFGRQAWEKLPCGSTTTIDKGALIDISGIG